MIKLIEKGKAVETADFLRDVHCIINYYSIEDTEKLEAGMRKVEEQKQKTI